MPSAARPRATAWRAKPPGRGCSHSSGHTWVQMSSPPSRGGTGAGRFGYRGAAMKIGLTLPNRGVLFGATTAEEMLKTAEVADQSGAFQSVWVGDSLFGKPRMESVALLAGVAARTRHVRLGAACMASFTLRDPVQLAYHWASLDLLAEE